MTNQDALEKHIRSIKISGSLKERRDAFARLLGSEDHGNRVNIGNTHGVKIGDGLIDTIWLHGGGYVFGSADTHSRAAKFLSQASGRTIFLPDYPLAPEYNWDEILKSICNLIADLPDNLNIIGDSAGGHLAIFTAHRYHDKIRSVILFSPNTDRMGVSQTRVSARDIMNDDAGDDELFEMSVPNTADNDMMKIRKRMSTSSLDLSFFPRTAIYAASNEILLGDSMLFTQQLALAGRDISMRIYSGLFHMFQQWPDQLPQARDALKSSANFINMDG